jgi:hypothetical protein
MATHILDHMVTKRSKPLHPDTTTYNILIRSGSLLRHNSIVEAALQKLRRKASTKGQVLSSTWLDASDEVTNSKITDPKSSQCLPQIHSEEQTVPDHFTLTSYIVYLTSIGRPHAVANLLFHLIPELSIIPHPSWGNLTSEEKKRLRIASRAESLRQAVLRGPYFFAAVLNALTKAGKTGLAERVWFLAKEAERASWIPGFIPDGELRQWCLPIQAYTTMMQCYANEVQKGLQIKRSGHSTALAVELATSSDCMEPQSPRFVRGWARFITDAKEQGLFDRWLPRNEAAQQMGSMLMMSMRTGARDVYNALQQLQHTVPSDQRAQLQIPIPDARFFNAALDVYTRQDGMRVRGCHSRPAHWRRQRKLSERWYAKFGITSKHWSPAIQEISEEMERLGYQVPDGLRHWLVGRGHSSSGGEQRSLTRSTLPTPFKFGKYEPRYRPHALPTVKERGLPRRKRWLYRPRTPASPAM